MRSQEFLISLLTCSIISLNISILVGCNSQQTNNDNSNSAPTSSIAQKTKNENNNSAFTNFATPSGNIHCVLEGKEQDKLRCEIRSMLNPIPPQSKDDHCEFDWGAGFLLPKSAKPDFLCISQPIPESDYTLAYGNSWSYSGFNCKSEATGLTCTNENKQGFFLSREEWKIF